MTNASATAYYGTDALGSVTSLTGPAGTALEKLKKDIVGNGYSKYDIFRDKKTGELYVQAESGVGEPQRSGEYLN